MVKKEELHEIVTTNECVAYNGDKLHLGMVSVKVKQSSTFHGSAEKPMISGNICAHGTSGVLVNVPFETVKDKKLRRAIVVGYCSKLADEKQHELAVAKAKLLEAQENIVKITKKYDSEIKSFKEIENV
ncbi:MAG: hypothetical protein LBG88_03485 [Christensenellaceae bacterium]|jgi:hypothetical protein|nr:hypothetical protein [Christensenellaceae bacterium]